MHTNPYFLTYDNPRGGDYSSIEACLRPRAFVKPTAPKTSFVFVLKDGTKFKNLLRAIERNLDPTKGRATLVSTKTKRVRDYKNGQWKKRKP
jgi:hypothetical protein